MVARNTFAVLLAVCLALVSADDSAVLIQKLVHHREFEITMGKVSMELELFKARDECLGKAGTPAGADCVRNKADQMKNNCETFIREQIEAVAPKLDAMHSITLDASATEQQLTEAAKFSKELTYDAYKSACRKTLIKVIPEWIAARKKEFETCYGL